MVGEDGVEFVGGEQPIEVPGVVVDHPKALEPHLKRLASRQPDPLEADLDADQCSLCKPFFEFPEDSWGRVRTAVVIFVFGLNAMKFAFLTQLRHFGLPAVPQDLLTRSRAARARVLLCAQWRPALLGELQGLAVRRDERYRDEARVPGSDPKTRSE